MNAALNTAENTADDMALLGDLLGGDGVDMDLSGELGDIDMSLDDLDMDDLNVSVNASSAEVGTTVESAADLTDDDALDLDLDDDAKALMDAAAGAEGVDNLSDLPPAAAASTEAAPKKTEATKKAARPATTARTTYSNAKASEVLRSRLGGSVFNELILEFSDAELPQAELEAKQAELMDLLNVRPHQSKDSSTQKKVAEKVVMLFAYLKNGGKLNEVMARTFKVLAKDGYVQMGKGGNLFAELLSKPYSVGTANAQGGQMMQMLPMLRIAIPDAANKGRLVVNPESAIFARIAGLLGLAA